MKAVSREQACAVMTALMANVDWDELDGKLLQDEVVAKPKDAGKRFTGFLKNGARTVTTVVFSFILKLLPFSVAEFLGSAWSVLERDEREDALLEVDWSKVEFETCLKEGEPSITGEEKLRRLKEGKKLCLGGRAFMSLWQDYQTNKEASVLEQLYKTKGVIYVDFFGLVLRRPDGYRAVLYLYRDDDGDWGWYYSWLGNDWNDRPFSAVLQVSS